MGGVIVKRIYSVICLKHMRLCALFIALAVCFAALPALADTTDTAGTWGTCAWTLQDGVLTLSSGAGADTAGVSPWADICENVHRVVIGNGVTLPADCSGLFANFVNVSTIMFDGADTSSVTSMELMFSFCRSLTALDVSEFDTSSVTTMNSMFDECRSLTALDVTGFDTSAVRDFWYMFSGCASLTELDVSGFDTSAAETLYGMFYDCAQLEEIDVSGFTAGNALSGMDDMFRGCAALKQVDLSGLATANIYSIYDLFTGCEALERVTVGEGFASFELPDGEWHSEADGGHYDSEDIANDRMGMADTYTRLNLQDASGLWGSCEWTLEQGMLVLESGEGADTAGICPWAEYADSVLDVIVTRNVKLPADCSGLFANMVNAVEIGFYGGDSASVENMSFMFDGCAALQRLVLRGLNTVAAQNMSAMFRNCGSLTSLTLGVDFALTPDTEACLRRSGFWVSQSSGTWYGPENLFRQCPYVEDTYTLTPVDETMFNFRLPEGTVAIEAEAFADTDAEWVLVSDVSGKTVTVASGAFSDCDALKAVWFRDGANVQIEDGAFDGSPDGLVLICADEDSAVADYAAEHGLDWICTARTPGEPAGE